MIVVYDLVFIVLFNCDDYYISMSSLDPNNKAYQIMMFTLFSRVLNLTFNIHEMTA